MNQTKDIKYTIKSSERELRSVMDDNVIPKANTMMQRAQIKRIQGLSECLKIKQESERVACRSTVEHTFKERHYSVTRMMFFLQDQMHICVSSCKTDLTQDTGDCIANCVKGLGQLCKQV